MKNFKRIVTSFIAVLSVFATFAFTACEPTNNNGGGNNNGGEGGNGGGNNTPTYTTIDEVLEKLKDFNPTSATLQQVSEAERVNTYKYSDGTEETNRDEESYEIEAKANFADGDADYIYNGRIDHEREVYDDYTEYERQQMYVRNFEWFTTPMYISNGETPWDEMYFEHQGNIYGGEYFEYITGETLDEFLPDGMTQEDIAPLAFGYEAYTVLKLAKDYQSVTQEGNTFTVDVNKLIYNLTTSTITILDGLSSTTTVNALLQEPTIKNLVDAVNYDLSIDQILALTEFMIRGGMNDQDAERAMGIIEKYVPEENVSVYDLALELASSEELAAELGYEGTLGEQSVFQLLNDFDIDFNEYWPEYKAQIQEMIKQTEIYYEVSGSNYIESYKYSNTTIKYVADENGNLLSQESQYTYIQDHEYVHEYDEVITETSYTEENSSTTINYSSQKQTMADLSERYIEEYLGWGYVENGTTDKAWGYVYYKYDEVAQELIIAHGCYELTMVDGAISNVKIYEDDTSTEITSNYNAETGLLTYTYNGEVMEVSVTKVEGETYAFVACDDFSFGIEIGKNNYEYTSIPEYLESLNSAE